MEACLNQFCCGTLKINDNDFQLYLIGMYTFIAKNFGRIDFRKVLRDIITLFKTRFKKF